MQDLLQRLSELREIVASGPVVMNQLDSLVKAAGTPAEAMMILMNANFGVTRQAPRVNNSSRVTQFDFHATRTISNGRSFV